MPTAKSAASTADKADATPDVKTGVRADTPVPAKKRTRGGPKGLRITDVAAQAGVSPITVSRVFNNPESVAPETLERVRQVVQKLGYVPNRLAGGLSSSRSRLVAAIVPTITHSLFSETIQVFSETLSRAGYEVLLALSGYSALSEESLLETVLSRRPEGVLLTGVAHTDSLRERLANVGIPVIETWDTTKAPIDMLVGFSHYEIGAAVAEHFLDRGASRPALISANDARALARRAGFRGRLAQAGIRDVAEQIVVPPSSVAAGKRELPALLARAPGIDAVFCGSDLLALGALGAARQLALEVPKQLKICGFGDLEFAAEITPQLSTVRVDGTRIGLNAARFLLDRLNGAPGGSGESVVDVGFSLLAREST